MRGACHAEGMTLLFWLLVAGLVAYLAGRKGRRAWVWFLYGFAIWPLALVHVLLARPSHEALRARLVASGAQRPCPHCQELVRSDATACPHCGRDIGPTDGAWSPAPHDG